MEVFRRHGYAGTSIKSLERGTGLSSGSIYNSFGDKDAIFRKALAHYNNVVVAERMREHLKRRSSVEGLRSLFLSLLDEPDGGSSGCLLTNSAVEFGLRKSSAKGHIQSGFQIEENAFLAAFECLTGVSVNAPAQALKLLALYQGVLVLVRSGYSKARLREMINDEFNTFGGERHD